MSFMDSAVALSRKNHTPPVHTLTLNGDSRVPGATLRISDRAGSIDSAVLKRAGQQDLNVPTSYFRNFDTIMGSSFFKAVTNYRDIKRDPTWRSIYDIERVAWNKINPKTGEDCDEADDEGKIYTHAVFCRECGLQIPLTVATVDHQAARSGGETKAMFRFFRAIGCTESIGIGLKSQNRLFYFRRNGMMVTDSIPDCGEDGGGKLTRYTLNGYGILYYSILKESGLLDDFKSACMHGGFNLRPVCPPCNSRLQNSGATIGLG